MYQLEVVTTRDRLEQLEPEWNALADRLRNPLLRHEWFAEAAAAFSAREELAVHVLRDDGAARAIVPLVHRRAGPVTRLQMLGAENYEPEALLWDDAEALTAACEAVARLDRPLLLFRLGADSPELAQLCAVHRGRGRAVVRASSTRSYCNPVSSDWRGMELAMSPKKRKELQRRRRKLEETGTVAFETVTPSPNEVAPVFDAFVQMEGSGWKGRDGTAIAQRPAARAFYLNYGRRLAGRGMLRFCFLLLNGEMIAGQYLVEHARKLWALKIGYDERFAGQSPGAQLTHEVLRWASANGLVGFEHLGVAEDWQRRWPVEVREHSTLRLYPASLAGGAALAMDTAGYLRRRVRERAGGGAQERASTGSAAQAAGAAA